MIIGKKKGPGGMLSPAPEPIINNAENLRLVYGHMTILPALVPQR